MSKYEVIARKWRPQTFEYLVGQSHVSQTLLNALKSQRIPHALLFTGPRGTGKTSSARIFAKALRCTQSKDHVPCGTCNDCVDISAGRHIDVVEIDGASNNGVDSVRELRDSVGYLPSTGTYKIYIIDEVHMLSTSAFNALLKTLEEPPPHVIFILATTEVQKLPNTILSRCQRFDFKTISQKEIQEHLAHICKTDGVVTSPEALWLIARQAKGSMRDGQSLLDQIITFCNKNITLDKVTEILGLSGRETINKTLTALASQNALNMAQVLREFNQTGADPDLFLEELLEQLRNALMIKLGAHKAQFPIHLPDSEILFLEEWSTDLSEEDIHLLFDLALKGSQSLRMTTDPRLGLEMLLLKLTSAPRVVALDQYLSGNNPTSRTVQSAPSKVISMTPPPPAAPIAAPTKVNATAMPAANSEGHRATVPAPAPLVKDPWMNFVESVRGVNGLLAALLEHTFIVKETTSLIELGVPNKMSFLIDKLNDKKNVSRLQDYLKEFWQKDLAVKITLTDPIAKDVVTPKDKYTHAENQKQQHQKQQVEDHPLVKKTRNLFKTEIVSIKEEKPI